MQKVSIVVPIYNKEKCLHKCLDSLIHQTYTNIEIILINDGSLDDSIKICIKYKEQDNRIKLIDKTNEGVEIARDVGIKESTGYYVTFVDSDDYIPKNSIELLVNAIEKNEADISFGNLIRVIGKKGLIHKKNRSFNKQDKVINQKDFIDNHLKSFCGWGEFPVNMCGKLYKRNMLQDYDFSNLRYGEDLCFNIQIIPKASKIAYTNKNVYYYRWGGVTTFLVDRMFNDYIKQYLFKINYFIKYGKLECIEYSNIELTNVFLSYIESCLLNYDNNEKLIKKINYTLNNKVLQKAVNSVKSDWFNKSALYHAIQVKDINTIIEIKKVTYLKRRLNKGC